MTTLELTWLGQASFVVRAGSVQLGIDIFLSPHDMRVYDAPRQELIPTDVSLFLCSHLHGDHFDARALRELARQREIRIVVPEGAVAQAASEVPTAEVIGLAAGGELELDGVTIFGIGVTHGDEPADAYREGPYLAFVVDVPGCPPLLHAGDLIPSGSFLTEAKRLRPDVWLMPINGRDWFRESAGFVGNMNAEEAARMASEGGASVVVPMHYDAMIGNTADPADLVRHVRACAADVAVLVPARNRTVAIGRGR